MTTGRRSSELPLSDWPGSLASTLWVKRFFSVRQKRAESQQKGEGPTPVTQSSQKASTSLGRTGEEHREHVTKGIDHRQDGIQPLIIDP